MRNLFDHHFTLGPNTRVYIPSEIGRTKGECIRSEVEDRWLAPTGFYHLKQGGHVAAVRLHSDAAWLASLDLERFFDQITRTKVHRALKRIGVSHANSWEMACDSTVDKRPPLRRFSLPFGFVQSPILASVVLAQSALGVAIRKLQTSGQNVSVYVDDITISGAVKSEIEAGLTILKEAANLSGFKFNPQKTQLPSETVTNFNIEFGNGKMEIVEERLIEFEAALLTGSDAVKTGILGYVLSVNRDQFESIGK